MTTIWAFRLLRAVLIGGAIGGIAYLAIKHSMPPTPSPRALNPAIDVPVSPLPPIPAALLKAPRLISSTLPELFVPLVDGQPTPIKPIGSLHGLESPEALGFTPDGRFLVAADYGDMTLRVWDLIDRTEVAKRRHNRRLTSMAIMPDGRAVLTGDTHQNLVYWPLSPAGELGTPISCASNLGIHVEVAISPNGQLIATSSFSKILAVFDATTRAVLVHTTLDEPLRQAAFSMDNARLVIGTITSVLIEYDLATGNGRKISIPRVQANADLTALVFSPDGRLMSTGHTQPWVTVWDATAMPMQYKDFLLCEMAGVTAVIFSAEGSQLIFALGNQSIYVWNPADRHKPVAQLQGHTKPITALALSPSGTVLAAADAGGTIILWGR